jgi:hypothetical protein
MTATEFWRKLEKTGWLKYVPETEHERLRDAVTRACATEPERAIHELALFDFEFAFLKGTAPTEPHSYTALLARLAAVSNGKFAPTEVTEVVDAQEGVIRVSFRHGKKTYSDEVYSGEGIFHASFLEVVNEALRSARVRQQFHGFLLRDMRLRIVFVPTAVYSKAIHAGLIP